MTEHTEMESSTLQDAYFDRNQVVMALALLCRAYRLPVGIQIPGGDSDWPILFIDLPQGQVSWHLPANEITTEFPLYSGEWDGHTLEQKRERLAAFIEHFED